jgi:hypothetical protein
MLDDEAQQAARELAVKLQVSTSQAIRQAIVGYRNIVVGVVPEVRKRRLEAFHRLVELMDGKDPEQQIQAARSDDGF